MLFFSLLGIYGKMIAYLPSWCVLLLCALLARIACMTSLKSHVEHGMSKFLLKSDCDVAALAKNNIQFLIDMLHNLLVLRYRHQPKYKVLNSVHCEDIQYLEKGLQGDTGVILVSLHMGNFFWSISYLSYLYAINLVVRGEGNPKGEDFALKMRQKSGIKTIGEFNS